MVLLAPWIIRPWYPYLKNLPESMNINTECIVKNRSTYYSTQPNPTHHMCWKMRPNPTQPNPIPTHPNPSQPIPWMDPTHVHLWVTRSTVPTVFRSYPAVKSALTLLLVHQFYFLLPLLPFDIRISFGFLLDSLIHSFIHLYCFFSLSSVSYSRVAFIHSRRDVDEWLHVLCYDEIGRSVQFPIRLQKSPQIPSVMFLSSDIARSSVVDFIC
jgi:hypothetical protein